MLSHVVIEFHFGMNFLEKMNNAGIFEPLKLYINFPYAYSYSPYGISGHSLNFVKNKNYFTLESESQPLDYELYYTFVEIGDDLYLHKR